MQDKGRSIDGASPRVVITGIGAITPLGLTWQDSWKAMLEGRSATRPITHFDASGFPTRIAALVKDFDPTKYMELKEAKRLGRITQFGWAAVLEAVSHACLDLSREDPERVGLDIGSAFGALDILEEQSHTLRDHGPRRINPAVAPAVLISTTPCYVAIRMGIQGPVNSQVTACASGIVSIGEAARRLQRGEVDVMLAGGADAYASPLIMAAFSRLGAMSTRNDEPERACRPFDRTRDGMVLGEGAVIMVLETLEHAQARGARILAEFAGYSLTADAYNLAAPEPTGRGAARAMSKALAESGLSPEDVDYICAHGTGTQLNDASETAAIKRTFGEVAYQIPVSSIKSMVGHMMGAAGAASAAVLVQAINDGIIPPTINYQEPDPECDLDYVPNKARCVRVDAAMCNAFGFGGQNASLLLKRFQP
ncbi:MAG: beta-ketoacyl-ACP synthase II [Anaerolineae bacterium]|nr:beta-ketoacyl-ACP synthase II [Anaerolineae bacterium]MDW8098239.1 beta-ketoacyl-ACP synthase II [Anaerolineae bacterium]